MSDVRTHKDLEIWQRGIALVEETYRITKSFPREEVYGLTWQLRKSAVSYPSNIAEGAARSSKKEYVQFLHFSLGSLSEVETQLMIAGRLGYLKADGLLGDVEALRRMTLNLIKYLKSKG